MRGSDSGADNGGVNAWPLPLQPRAALRALALAVLATGAVAPDIGASEARDHERARAAVQAGEVLPLPALLARLQRTHPGQVLELELEREHGRWIYEVKLLQAGGQLLKLELDAATGQLLEAGRRRSDRADRADRPASVGPTASGKDAGR